MLSKKTLVKYGVSSFILHIFLQLSFFPLILFSIKY